MAFTDHVPFPMTFVPHFCSKYREKGLKKVKYNPIELTYIGNHCHDKNSNFNHKKTSEKYLNI